MPANESSTRSAVASSLAAMAGAMAALSCCLPLGPFLLAAGSAGAAGVLVSLQPYLIGFSALMLAVGFFQAFRARQCGRKRRAINLVVLLASTGLVAAMVFAYVPAKAPSGQAHIATLDAGRFKQLFNGTADHPRIIALLSPT
jgi:hypothetical protein